MIPKVISTKARFTNVFLLIQDGKGLLVDTGSRGQSGKIQKAITSTGLAITDLKYIFLTHTHYDHAGSAAELKQLSGAKIIVHESEAECLIDGFKPIPKGTVPFFKLISKAAKIKKSQERKIGCYPPVKPDITFSDRLDLSDLGFDATIVHMPGHTTGSSGLLFKKKAIVGDCMFNLRGKLYPFFADDEKQLCESWRTILKLDVDLFYPAHGKRFSLETLKREATKKGIV